MFSRFTHLLVAAIAGTILAGIAGVASAQTVTYSLGASSDLLSPNFYTGGASTANSSEPAIGPVSRFVLNVGVNNAGTQAVFGAIRSDSLAVGLFKVNIGDPSSWVRLLPDRPFDWYEMMWAQDESAVFFGHSKYTFAGGILVDTYTNHGYTPFNGSVTRKATDNWRVAPSLTGTPANSEIFAFPILPNGDADPARDPVIVTNFGLVRPVGNGRFFFSYVSSQGDAVAFNVQDSPSSPDISDVYLLENFDAIVTAPKIPSTDISSLAPTSFSDPNVVDIRASDSSNPAYPSGMSQDGTLVFYEEDYTNLFDANVNFFALGPVFNINLARRDGTGDVRFTSASNQAILTAFPSGNRLTYAQSVSGPQNSHIFATTLVAANDIGAVTSTLPPGGTTAIIGGQTVLLPFTLSDSAVQATTAAGVVDAAGTTIALPADQVINFPDGTPTQQITVFTPVFPVTNIQLPDPNISIPVIRDFGPLGTQFYPPITITITYTDAEVSNLANESSMIPYLFNAGTQQYEPIAAQFLPSVVVNTVNNTVSFQTDHFSIYGIGGPKAPSVPQRPWTWVVLAASLMCAAGLLLAARKRIAKAF
jgi:hypothetical protein